MGEVDKAKEMLNEYDIEYYSNQKGSNRQDGKQGEIGTQGAYGDESKVTIMVYQKDGNVYEAMGSVSLTGSKKTGILQYVSKAPDACGLHWDNDDWEAKDPDEDNVESTIYFGGSGDGPDIDVKDYDSNHGIAAKVKIDNEAQLSWDTWHQSLQILLKSMMIVT